MTLNGLIPLMGIFPIDLMEIFPIDVVEFLSIKLTEKPVHIRKSNDFEWFNTTYRDFFP